METKNNLQNAEPAMRIPLPNSTAVLILGIFSIVTSCCCGFVAFVGLVLGIVSLVLGSKAVNLYQADPSRYTENSFKNVNAGKICSIIGIVISGIMIMIGLIYLFVVGAAIGTIFSTFPWNNIIN